MSLGRIPGWVQLTTDNWPIGICWYRRDYEPTLLLHCSKFVQEHRDIIYLCLRRGCLFDNLYSALLLWINLGMYSRFPFCSISDNSFISLHLFVQFTMPLAAWVHPRNQTTNERSRAVLPFLSSLWYDAKGKATLLFPLFGWSKVIQVIKERMFATSWWHGCIVSFLQLSRCHSRFHFLSTSMRSIPSYPIVYASVSAKLTAICIVKLSWPVSLHVRLRALCSNRPHL